MMRRSVVILPLGLLALWAAPASTQPVDDPPAEPIETGLVEEEIVAVAEIVILVTDRNGRPVTDLRAGEIRVFEKGMEQELAFLEAVSGMRTTPGDASGAPGPLTPPDETVPPTHAVRRVVIAFDVRNSRRHVRERWRKAARAWVSDGMGSNDRVGIVVLGKDSRWAAEFTDDRRAIDATLAGLTLRREAPSRDRRRDVSALMNDVRTCIESESGRMGSGFEGPCAYAACRPWVRRWTVEAAESVADLRSLVDHLAPIEGRKAILLLSEGITADPPMMAVNTIVAHWGSTDYNLDVQKMKLHLGRDLYDQLAEVHRLARSAGVGFFTLDTRDGAVDGFHGNLEHTGTLPAAALGIDAWEGMEDNTRRSLDALARETGGRSYLGLRDLDDNFRAAADGFFGMYTVGYYRASPDSPLGKVRVAIDRKNLDVSTPVRPDSARGRAGSGVYHE